MMSFNLGCGTANLRIVGGVEATENQLPWQCMIQNSDGSFYGCGATIISCDPVIIISAAHCFQGYDRWLTSSLICNILFYSTLLVFQMVKWSHVVLGNLVLLIQMKRLLTLVRLSTIQNTILIHMKMILLCLNLMEALIVVRGKFGQLVFQMKM